jgi:hypothetical protein
MEGDRKMRAILERIESTQIIESDKKNLSPERFKKAEQSLKNGDQIMQQELLYYCKDAGIKGIVIKKNGSNGWDVKYNIFGKDWIAKGLPGSFHNV